MGNLVEDVYPDGTIYEARCVVSGVGGSSRLRVRRGVCARCPLGLGRSLGQSF